MHLFAFLGTNPYSPCRYSYGKGEDPFISPPVKFVQTAISMGLGERLEAVTVFATEKAQRRNGDALREELDNQGVNATLRIESAPTGLDEDEMVQLFETLNDNVGNADEVVFDITHGYRSQPVLGLLILNYLQSVRPDIEIHDIVYGAFDFDQYDENGKSMETEFPVVSLMPIWELNGWAAAFRTFEQTGDTTAMTEKAVETQDRHMRALGGPPPGRPKLKTFGSYLQEWQQHLELCAVPLLHGDDEHPGLMNQFGERLATEWNPFSKEMGRFIEPLRIKMQEIVEPMTAPHWFSVEGLESQLAIMKWMQRHNRYQSLITMAREWLVVLMALALDRQPEEQHGFIGDVAAVGRGSEKPGEDIQRLIELFGDDFCSCVDTVAGARNNVNHCWIGKPMNSNPPKQMETTVNQLFDHFPIWLDVVRSREKDE